MSKLPEGWVNVSFSDLGEWGAGGTPKANDARYYGGDIPFAKIADLNDGVVTTTEQTLTELGLNNSSAKIVPEQSLLIAMYGSIGKLGINLVPMATNQAIAFLQPDERLALLRYLYWAFLSARSRLVSLGQGGTQQNISQSILRAQALPLPPVPEQRRIVAKIDGLTGKSTRARHHLDHMPRLVEKYKQAVLSAALRGHLTQEWRGPDAGGSEAWTNTTLVAVCEPDRPITYGVIKLGTETPGGVPCLRTSNVKWLRIDVDGVKRISKSLSQAYHRTVLTGGEVLVSVRGTLGGVAVVPRSMRGWNVSREVAVIPVAADIVDPRYAAYWVAADASQRWLRRVEKGVAYTGINIEDLRKLPIKYPRMDEQFEIVRRIETAFAWIDRLVSEATRARTLVDNLDKAILAKAFRGELVAQDRLDEPASVLLDRIKAERAAAPSQGRRRKKEYNHAHSS